MKAIKTLREYNKMKKEFSNEIDSFLKKFSTFTKFTSPEHWRETSYTYNSLKKFKDKLKEYKPIQLKHLNAEWVRDEVLDDEDKEIWNNTKKYNI